MKRTTFAAWIARALLGVSPTCAQVKQTKEQIPFYTSDWKGRALRRRFFLKGHRIRADVTSSHFQQFDRDPKTGEPFGTSAKVRAAQQTIQHSNSYPSHILLPVVRSRQG